MEKFFIHQEKEILMGNDKEMKMRRNMESQNKQGDKKFLSDAEKHALLTYGLQSEWARKSVFVRTP